MPNWRILEGDGEVERLEAEVERLRRKQEFEFNLNEDLQQQINRLREYETAYETMKAHAVQLEAEVERLTDLLGKAEAEVERWKGLFESLQKHTRAALAKDGG